MGLPAFSAKHLEALKTANRLILQIRRLEAFKKAPSLFQAVQPGEYRHPYHLRLGGPLEEPWRRRYSLVTTKKPASVGARRRRRKITSTQP
jgi:hypothetical protein